MAWSSCCSGVFIWGVERPHRAVSGLSPGSELRDHFGPLGGPHSPTGCRGPKERALLELLPLPPRGQPLSGQWEGSRGQHGDPVTRVSGFLTLSPQRDQALVSAGRTNDPTQGKTQRRLSHSGPRRRAAGVLWTGRETSVCAGPTVRMLRGDEAEQKPTHMREGEQGVTDQLPGTERRFPSRGLTSALPVAQPGECH